MRRYCTLLPFRAPWKRYIASFQLLTIGGGKCYDFGAFDLHHYEYNMWPINLFAGWGHEIEAAKPIGSRDEDHLSGHYPKAIKKRMTIILATLMVDCVALGSALAAHLHYAWQPEVGEITDVLDRYKALVVEKLGADLLPYDE